MKLLILTQKVDINDDLLGFFHDWIDEFSKHCEKVIVVALGVGEYWFPSNVTVLSLGKESNNFQFPRFAKAPTRRAIFNFQLFRRIKYLFHFYRYIWATRKNYDAVFVHMNKEYAILGGIIWKLMGKKVGLWYVHRQAGLSLKLAEKSVDVIFTSTSEGYGLTSKKLKIIGHGLDISKFNCARSEMRNNENYKIIYVGRISKIKNQRLLIDAVNILISQRSVKNIKVEFIGEPIYDQDRNYQEELVDLISVYHMEKYFRFAGRVPYKEIYRIYGEADLSVNLCPTGGMDKAVLESLASCLPVIVYNKAFSNLLSGHQDFLLDNLSREDLADKIFYLMNYNREKLFLTVNNLRERISKEYCLSDLIGKIVLGLSK